LPGCQTPPEREVVREARPTLAAYANMEELIRLGAYRAGSSQEVDEAVALMPDLEAFLGQGKEEATSIGEGYARLAQIVGSPG
jgi:flagellum-specific ATP synthase